MNGNSSGQTNVEEMFPSRKRKVHMGVCVGVTGRTVDMTQHWFR